MQPRDLHHRQQRTRCTPLAALALLLLAGLLVLEKRWPSPPERSGTQSSSQPPRARQPRREPRRERSVAAVARLPERAPTVLEQQPVAPPPQPDPTAPSAAAASECRSSTQPALRPLLADEPARCGGARHRCACAKPGLVVVRAEATGRYLTAFWGGGEVFAIGDLGRMPLKRMVFAMEPEGGGGGGGSAWMGLRHVSSGGRLLMLPKGAAQAGHGGGRPLD